MKINLPRLCNLLTEKLTQCFARNPAHQFSGRIGKGDRMITRTRARLPQGFCCCHASRQTFRIIKIFGRYRIAQRRQASLVGQNLPNRQLVFAMRPKFRPVFHDLIIVRKLTPFDEQRKTKGSHRLCSGPHIWQCIARPLFGFCFVGMTRP